jgi:starvation-inducible DNA-binding protein
VDGRSHVEALSSALAAFGKSARKAINDANDLGDLDTADLFTEISRGSGSSRHTCRQSGNGGFS